MAWLTTDRGSTLARKAFVAFLKAHCACKPPGVGGLELFGLTGAGLSGRDRTLATRGVVDARLREKARSAFFGRGSSALPQHSLHLSLAGCIAIDKILCGKRIACEERKRLAACLAESVLAEYSPAAFLPVAHANALFAVVLTTKKSCSPAFGCPPCQRHPPLRRSPHQELRQRPSKYLLPRMQRTLRASRCARSTER